MTKVLGTKLSTLWTRINTVLVPRQATVTTTGSYHIVTLQNAVTPTPDALVSFSIPASSGSSGDSNQNAFSNVKVGSSTISATAITDTLSITAGNNISLSVNSKTLTISATDTTYTAATVAPLAVSSSSVTGTSTNYARQDHTHSIAVTTGDSNGQVKIAGTNVSVKGLKSAAYTESSAYLPSNTTIPTAMSQLNNDAGYLTSADIPEGASAYSGTISTVTSGTATAGTNNGFARGDHVHNITAATITNALGYTPYSAANPNGYTSNTGTVTGVKINNSTKAPSSGVVDLGTVLTTYTYTLPTASTTTLGGIKIGNGLSINSTGVVSAVVTTAATTDHSHGSITNSGAITSDTTVTSSDKIVITDNSDNSKIKRSNIAFGTNDNTYLRKDGNWGTPSGIVTSVNSKTGSVSLTAADVGALPSSTTYVGSLNSKTGTVTITAGNNVTVSSSSNTITISATDTTYSNATTVAAGLMSAADKAKLDNYDTSMTVTGAHTEIVGHLLLKRSSATNGMSKLSTANDSASGNFFIEILDSDSIPSCRFYMSSYGNFTRQTYDGVGTWGDAVTFINDENIAARFTTEVSSASSGSIAASASKWVTVNCSKSGYKMLGPVGFYVEGNTMMNVYAFRGSSATECQIALRNTGTASATVTVNVTALYVKD